MLVQICESLLTGPSLPRSPGSHANSSGGDLIEFACLRGPFTCLVGRGVKGKQGEITCCGFLVEVGRRVGFPPSLWRVPSYLPITAQCRSLSLCGSPSSKLEFLGPPGEASISRSLTQWALSKQVKGREGKCIYKAEKSGLLLCRWVSRVHLRNSDVTSAL